jgi:hypothetical protein
LQESGEGERGNYQKYERGKITGIRRWGEGKERASGLGEKENNIIRNGGEGK